MNHRLSVLLSAAVFAVSTLAANAYAAEQGTLVKAGTLGASTQGAMGRAVKIDAATKNLNAQHFETLTIQNQKGQSFTWQFDTLTAPVSFPLKRIAPAGYEAGGTWVYVDHPYTHGVGN